MDHYFTNNNDLKSEIKQLEYSYNDYDLLFLSDNGVFSKSHIDYGSRLLVETFLKNTNNIKNVLDIGCGYGFIGTTVGKVLKCEVTMSDVNKRALHLCKRNLELNKVEGKVIESYIYDNIEGKFDAIITNPPIRAGKNIVLDILNGAKNHLNKDGYLWCVIRKDGGANSIEKIIKETYSVEKITKSNGFYVFRCKIY